MATIKLGLDTRTEKNGMCPVRIRINHNNTSAYIPTGVRVEPDHFNPDNLRQPIAAKAISAKIKNEQIAILIRKYDEVIFELQRSAHIDFANLTANEIRTYIIGERVPKPAPIRKAHAHGHEDFIAWFEKYGDSRASENTRKHYDYCARVIARYCVARSIQMLYFDSIDYSLLKDMSKWVADTIGDTTRYKVESYMRAAYFEGVKMGKYKGDNPYNQYSIVPVAAPQEIEYVPIDDLRKFAQLDVSKENGEKWFSIARDIILISWYLCGANMIDIYNMPEPHGDELVFVRHKMQTRKGKPIHIRIEPELRELIDRYKGDGRAFNFAQNTPNWYTFQRRVNDRLSRLSTMAKVDVRMSGVRRSWATYAYRSKFSQVVIDRSMGHVVPGVLFQHYASFDWSDTAACNRAMIDMLWNKE